MTSLLANTNWRQHPPSEFPPKGAVSWGYDFYGLWYELEIADVPVTMRWIVPGRFQMGSAEDEAERDEDEQQRWVTLTEGYWLAETTCTQALWEAAMDENPSGFKGQVKPVDTVSWNDAQKFLDAINETSRQGLEFVLPTEAQWEYACRAGTSTAFNLGPSITTDQVNFDGTHPYGDAPQGEYREETVEAKSFEPNAWGLYQMHGNVFEWCNDWYGQYEAVDQINPEGPESGDVRVLRGGCWISFARFCRSASRSRFRPSVRFDLIGFRFAQVTAAQAGAERPATSQK